MVDVTVRGAGAFGLAVAYACATMGAKVRVVDPHGAGAGSSGGLVGALAPHVPENWNEKKAFQFAALAMGAEFWAEVARVAGRDPGYARTGRLQPIADDHALELAEARANTAADLWQGRFGWEVIEAPQLWAPVSPTGLVIRDTLTARMAPRSAVAALAAAVATAVVVAARRPSVAPAAAGPGTPKTSPALRPRLPRRRGVDSAAWANTTTERGR